MFRVFNVKTAKPYIPYINKSAFTLADLQRECL